MKNKIWVIQLLIIGLLLSITGSCKKSDTSPRKDPIITWANPADIVYETLLSSTQLNATADVSGTFAYTPAIGTKLNVGDNQDLRVDFTPTDLAKYNIASKTVKINVINQLIFGSVTDIDGNVYKTITIGTQTWMAENLKTLHYSDGSSIPDVVSYNNTEENATKYGRLYTWDATMKGVTTEKAKGVSPDGWHIPSDSEWQVLENFLGGASIAGGKLKSKTDWKMPNTGATNSSGFTALAGGEYDANQFLTFMLQNEYAVFWTSTEVSSTKARERYLSYDNANSSIYDWYKIMKYSIRCIKD